MPKGLLLKTNLLVCLVIIAGFAVTSTINYKTNHNGYMDDIEHISLLTTEGIFYRLEMILAKPLNVSLAIANDSLLKSFLLSESYEEDEDFINTMRKYLDAYRVEYGYDSIFLTSAKTQRYYNFNGVNRVLTTENAENDWFYNFLETTNDYTLNIDNDEASQNEITIFVNCRIRGDNGDTLGIVGVGLKVDYLQNILMEYVTKLGVDIYLINEYGGIEIAEDSNGQQPVDFFDICGYPYLKERILESKEAGLTLARWVSEKSWQNFVVVQYIPELSWYLIVEKNTSSLDSYMSSQLFKSTLAAMLTGLIVMLAITYVIRRDNKQIIRLTAQIEQEKHKAFRNATEQLYDHIYEINISKNRALGDWTEHYFESFGLTSDAPFSEAIKVFAEKCLKDEHREGFVSMFSPDNILREYRNGNQNLEYEMLSDFDSKGYQWTRIVAYIYYREDEDSICMFTYHKNIEEEKRKEARLLEQAEMDGLTNVYNKTATEHYIEKMLIAETRDAVAFFIIDFDNFKSINDEYGHAFGDAVLIEFASIIKKCFRSDDIIGRIGGDEFVASLLVPSMEWTNKKAAELSKSLDTVFSHDGLDCKVSASIGVAVVTDGDINFESLYKNADSALYETKRRGKNGFTVYNKENLEKKS